jgi:hypothetical protein
MLGLLWDGVQTTAGQRRRVGQLKTIPGSAFEVVDSGPILR